HVLARGVPLQQREDPHPRMRDLEAGLAQIHRFHGVSVHRRLNASCLGCRWRGARSVSSRQSRRPFAGPRSMTMSRFAFVALIALATAGCGMLYKQPIYQGNLIEKDAVEQLQAGMDKQQVLVVLGTPSIADPFHHQRWDYTATQRTSRRGHTEVRNLTLWF